MAITITERVEYMDTAGGDTPTSGTYTPTADKFCLACAVVSGWGGSFVAPVGSGNGVDPWTRDACAGQSTFALAVWHALMGGSPTTTGFEQDWTGDTTTGAGVWVAELDGVHATSPIRQVSPLDNGSGGTTPSIAFGAATLADSAVVTFLHNTTNPGGVAVPTGYTSDVNLGHASPTAGFCVAHHLSPGSVTTVTWGGTSASAWRGFNVEIAAAAAALTHKNLTLLGVG